MDTVASSAVASSTAAEEVPAEENMAEYGPHLPDNYVPSSEQASAVSVSSRKRANADDEGIQDIDNLLDEAFEVKRPRLDEGATCVAGIHDDAVLSAERMSAELSEKLRMLNASKLGVSMLQLVLIQYETRISDYNNGAISGAYLMGKFQEASEMLDTYAVSVAPAGWKCYWNGEAKRYCFHNEDTGEYSWDYPTPQVVRRVIPESVEQGSVGVADESHTSMQCAAEQTVESPVQEVLERREETASLTVEATPTDTTEVTEEVSDALYSPQAPLSDVEDGAPPTNDDITSGSGDFDVHSSNTTGDHHHDNKEGDVTAVDAPLLPSAEPVPSGDITDSDEEIMEATTPPVMEDQSGSGNVVMEEAQNDWVLVERPSVTSDDQSLESVDSLTEECMEVVGPLGSCDPSNSSLGAQEEVMTEVIHDELTDVGRPLVSTAAVVTSSTLLSDTSSQGLIADDECDEDGADWWRSKGPSSSTKPSASTASPSSRQPKWTSLKLTKQLKSRWGVASPSVVTTTTAKEAEASSATSSKSSDVLAWFPEEEDKKGLALPTAEEIAETKQREEQIAAAVAAKKEREKEKALAEMEEKKKESEATVVEKEPQSSEKVEEVAEELEQGTTMSAGEVDAVTIATPEAVVRKEAVARKQEPKVSKEEVEDDESSSDSSDSSSSSSSDSSFTLSSGDSSLSSSDDEEGDVGKEKVTTSGKQSTPQDVRDGMDEQQVANESSDVVAMGDEAGVDKGQVLLEKTSRDEPPEEEHPMSADNLQQPLPSIAEGQQPLPTIENLYETENPPLQGETPVDDKETMKKDELPEAMEIEASPEHSDDVVKMDDEVVKPRPQQEISELAQEKAKYEQPVPSVEKQEVKESLTTDKPSESVKQMMTRDESPPPPPPPSTTGSVAMATNSPHYASTSTNYSQSTGAGSEGYSAYLQAYAYYAAHAQAQAAQYYASYPQAAAYARMYQSYGSPYGNSSSYGNQYDSTSYYNYAARAYAAQAQNYTSPCGGHQSEEDSSARSDKSKRK